MENILRDITDRRFSDALIRLWLLAESSQEGIQTLSRWLYCADVAEIQALSGEIARGLEQERPVILPEAALNPLAIIVALDRVYGEQGDLLASTALPELAADGRRYSLVRRRNGGDTPADRQSPNLEQWFRHFRVIPDSLVIGGAEIAITVVPLVCPRRRPRPAGKSVRLRVSHFADNARLELHEDQANERFHVSGLTDETARKESLRRELEATRASEADIWLAPELCVSPALRNELALSLVDQCAEHLLLCVPGSFHETHGGERVNRAQILDGDGISVAVQDKLSQFSYPSSNNKLLHEDIVVSRKITLLSTSIGLIGVAICKDYCDAAATGLIQSAWNRLAPDWLLVPSMGDGVTLQAHEATAHTHWKLHRLRSVIANQEPPEGQHMPGFVCCDATVVRIDAGGSDYPPPDPGRGGNGATGRRLRIRRIK